MLDSLWFGFALVLIYIAAILAIDYIEYYYGDDKDEPSGKG